MAWGKVFRVIAGYASGEGPAGDALDFTGLDILFKIYRSVVFSECKAEITIINPTVETRNKFLDGAFSDLNIYAGYEDETVGLIYSGHILDAHPEGDGGDSRLVLVSKPLRGTGFSTQENHGESISYTIAKETRRVKANTYLNLSYDPNSQLSDVIKAIGTALEIPVIGADAVNSPLPNGFNYTGSLKTAIKQIGGLLWCAGFGHFMDLKEWVIFNRFENTVTTTIAQLTKASGLLSVAPAKLYEYDPKKPEVLPPDKTWEVRSILNPAFAPNALVDIDTTGMNTGANIRGVLLINSIEFIGDTMGGPFDATLVCSSKKIEELPPPEVMAGEGSSTGIA